MSKLSTPIWLITLLVMNLIVFEPGLLVFVVPAGALYLAYLAGRRAALLALDRGRREP
jgi:hypothetical protein